MKCISGDELDPNVCVLAALWANYAEFVRPSFFIWVALKCGYLEGKGKRSTVLMCQITVNRFRIL